MKEIIGQPSLPQTPYWSFAFILPSPFRSTMARSQSSVIRSTVQEPSRTMS